MENMNVEQICQFVIDNDKSEPKFERDLSLTYRIELKNDMPFYYGKAVSLIVNVREFGGKDLYIGYVDKMKIGRTEQVFNGRKTWLRYANNMVAQFLQK